MIVEIENKKYFVRWERTPDQYITECTIKDESDNEIANGIARKSPYDAHNKDKSRRISMEHALNKFPKMSRRVFWEKYRTMTKNPRW